MDSSCLRKVSNWSSLEKEHKFDKETFDAAKFMNDLPIASPKLMSLLLKIKELDEQDIKMYGKKFKHFIFSEVKAGGYGARVIAGGLKAAGLHLCYTPKLVMKSQDVLLESKNDNFGYLCSTTIYEQPMTTILKKNLLDTFNKRPDNINGELIRFMIADGGFKEGIDLFDVKYVHIFEPQTSDADKKQAIGRATRKCGQAGLEFVPTSGWTLYVYIYDTLLPSKLHAKYDSMTLYDLYLKNSKIDLKKINFGKEIENLTILGAIDYPLTKNLLSGGELEGEVIKKKPQPPKLGDKVYCHRVCSIHRPSKFVPASLPVLCVVAVVQGGKLPPKKSKKPRGWFCELLKNDNDYCSGVKEAFENPRKYIHNNSNAIEEALEANMHMQMNRSLRYTFLKFVYNLLPKKIQEHIIEMSNVQKAITIQNSNVYKNTNVEIDTAKPFEYLIKDIPRFTERMDFENTREFIVDNYSMFTWNKPEMINLCPNFSVKTGGSSDVDEALKLLKEMDKELKKPTNNQVETSPFKSKIATFTPTQDFLRHYFTPNNPYKGMLLWHSVGTGKTCSAIATATSTFEKEGWTILWVTRTTLKDDIWKNMFDTVCSLSMQEKINQGIRFPSKMTDRMKFVPNNWTIKPMSYKQFTNLISGNNQQYYQQLSKRNGVEDPLRKTLLIIDEAHKLYGGYDLLPAEKPDMRKFKATLNRSYEISGQDSVKLLLMTATPYSQDPMELIKLINLIKEPKEQLPSSFDEFEHVFLDQRTGLFTDVGKKVFLNNINGLISYLDRGSDVREFAQPKIELINTLMSERPIADIESLKKELDEKVFYLKSIIKELDDRFLEFKSKKMQDYKQEVKEYCGKLKGQEYLDCKNNPSQRMIDILDNIANMKNKISDIKVNHQESIKKLIASFNQQKEIYENNISQEHIIETRCDKNYKVAKKIT